MKVLVIDDDHDFLTMIQDLTAMHGIPCDVTHSGGVALDLVKSHSYTHIFCDLMMPGISGKELINIMGADVSKRVFLVSGQLDEGIIGEMDDLGVVTIKKPCSPTVFEAIFLNDKIPKSS